MPFMIEPIACSRIPKCRVRPYGPPGHILVWNSAGVKLGSPSMVVLLLSARSAEPPHSSGTITASAESTLPEAARVETAFALPSFSVGKLGRFLAQPAGSSRRIIRSSSAAPSASPAAQSSKRCCHSACAARPRATTSRAWASTSASTAKCTSGSKPRIFLVLRISSSPRADPCAAPVFCFVGAGQPMIVRTAMIDGRSVTRCAFLIAASRATTSSPESTRWVCQP